MKVVARSGIYWRVADPDWDDPFNGAWSMRHGARWNARGSFSVLYLNGDVATAAENARAVVERAMNALALNFEDLDPSGLPIAIPADVPKVHAADALSDEGLGSLGLPHTYPVDDDGKAVPWSTCQKIGQQIFDAGVDGIACRSAAIPPGEPGKELALFDRTTIPKVVATGPALNWEQLGGHLDR